MTTFACFSFQDLLIPLGFALALGAVITFALALGAVITFVIIKVLRSGGSI